MRDLSISRLAAAALRPDAALLLLALLLALAGAAAAPVDLPYPSERGPLDG